MNFQNSAQRKATAEGSNPGVADFLPSGGALPRPFLTFIGLVAVLAAIYYGLIAAPMYVSHTSFTVRSQQVASPTSILAGLSGNSTGLADIVSVQEQILSHEMLAALDKRYNLRAAYSRFRPDLYRWLPPKASEERFLQFYRRMVTVKLDRQANIVEVDVRSFDRAMAGPIANTLLQRTEDFVDGMTQRVRSETMKSAQAELDRARQEADAARLAMANFRGATSSVNAAAGAAQALGGEAAMEGQAAAAQAELASALTFNKPDAPVIMQLRARLASIRTQQARYRAQQGPGGGARQATAYETLTVQRDNAERKAATAAAAFDSARALAQQREKYVVRIVNPSAPDKPTEPKRVLDFLMVMLFALTGYAIVSLAIAGVRDHRGV